MLPGQPIPISAIRDPYLVRQGKTALVVFEHGGLTITMHALHCSTAVLAISNAVQTSTAGR